MKRLLLSLLALTGMVAAPGCGGGGGGGSTAAYPLSYTSRLYAIGNHWEYRITGTATSSTGERATLTGTASTSVIQQAIGGDTFLGLSHAMDLRSSAGGSIVSSGITYFLQDATSRDVRTLGDVTDSDPIRGVTSTPLPVTQPGTWTTATSLAYTLHYTDSTFCTNTFTVTSTEVVRVPAGAFTTWRTMETTNDSKYGSGNSTCWYAPQLGCAVKETFSKSYSDGSRLDVTMELTSTNVPLS